MAKGKNKRKEEHAVYKVIEIVGTSPDSWAQAGRHAVEAASSSLKDLRVAEVDKLDIKIEGGKLVYRAKLKVSFKYHTEM